MRTLIAIIVVVDVYVIVYYRLLVRFYYEQERGVKEGTFGALFSFPPYARLPEKGKTYARRYWVAVGVLTACVAVLAVFADFSFLRDI